MSSLHYKLQGTIHCTILQYTAMMKSNYTIKSDCNILQYNAMVSLLNYSLYIAIYRNVQYPLIHYHWNYTIRQYITIQCNVQDPTIPKYITIRQYIAICSDNTIFYLETMLWFSLKSSNHTSTFYHKLLEDLNETKNVKNKLKHL